MLGAAGLQAQGLGFFGPQDAETGVSIGDLSSLRRSHGPFDNSRSVLR